MMSLKVFAIRPFNLLVDVPVRGSIIESFVSVT
jgi:hypothetical protein